MFATLARHGRRARRRADRARRHDAGRHRRRRVADRPRGLGRVEPIDAAGRRSGRFSIPPSCPRSPHGSATTSSRATARHCSAPTTRLGSRRSWRRSRTSRATGDERPRATIRVAFTVDEEVGRGAEDFDLDAFGADVAYTLDGSDLGELEVETFSAASVRVTIRGLSVHPGTAKGKLVNAVKLASELVLSVPADRLSPETTEDREGYVHPHRISGSTPRRRSSTSSRATTTTTSSPRTSSSSAGSRAQVEVREPRAKVDDRGARLVPQHAARSSRRTRESSRPPSRRSGAPASSRGSPSRAAERTAPCSPPRGCRRRISSRAARSTTRCASGRACRTWPPRPRPIVELAGSVGGIRHRAE